MDAAVVPFHPGAQAGVVHVHAQYPRQLFQVLLVEPDTGSTGDAFQHQRRFALVAFAMHEALLQLGGVIKPDLLQQVGRQRLGPPGIFGAVLVIVVQPGVDDGLRHGLAAGTAGGMG